MKVLLWPLRAVWTLLRFIITQFRDLYVYRKTRDIWWPLGTLMSLAIAVVAFVLFLWPFMVRTREALLPETHVATVIRDGESTPGLRGAVQPRLCYVTLDAATAVGDSVAVIMEPQGPLDGPTFETHSWAPSRTMLPAGTPLIVNGRQVSPPDTKQGMSQKDLAKYLASAYLANMTHAVKITVVADREGEDREVGVRRIEIRRKKYAR